MLDLESLITILEACDKNKIAELVVKKDAVEIRTVAMAAKGGTTPVAITAPTPQISIPTEEKEIKESADQVDAISEPTPVVEPSNIIELTAPTPGVAYVYPGTTIDRKPLPKEGDIVEMGQVVALVEAMKMFNEVTAPKKAKIVKIKVENESLVKIGDLIMVLEPL
ncbi:MAG: acetyl-CoA carboxylase biotin carboxyl carrier protein [Candidatus Methanofastidiosia archaeon]